MSATPSWGDPARPTLPDKLDELGVAEDLAPHQRRYSQQIPRPSRWWIESAPQFSPTLIAPGFDAERLLTGTRPVGELPHAFESDVISQEADTLSEAENDRIYRAIWGDDPVPEAHKATQDQVQARAKRNQTPSAVLAIWHPVNGEPNLILTRRSWQLRSHAGEVSFPGGAREPSDRSLLDTALREAHEEIGVSLPAGTVVGRLPSLRTLLSQRLIVPYVAVSPHTIYSTPDPVEVDAIIEVPLSLLTSPQVAWQERWGRPDGFKMWLFGLGDDLVWGVTGAILGHYLSGDPIGPGRA